MFGLAVFSIVGLYILVQIAAPVAGFWLAKKWDFGKKAAIVFAVFGFLLVFVPVWYKQLPAMIVFQYLKRDAGIIIHKSFEQWIAENPGVLEGLEEIEPDESIEYISTLIHNGVNFMSFLSLFFNRRQRIVWYRGKVSYIDNRVKKFINILYDIEKKEILATDVSIEIYNFGFRDFSSRYDGPFLGPKGISFIVYRNFFLHHLHKEK